MEEEEEEQVFAGNCHFFEYNPKNFYGPALIRKNFAMPGGRFPGLTEYSKQVEERTEKYVVYRCDEMHCPLLAILKVEKYTFFFYFEQDEYFGQWKQKYGYATTKTMLKDFLPEEPAKIEYIQIPMNGRAIRF